MDDSSEVLRFDRYALDLARGSVRTPDGEIALRPKAFEVLRHLVERSGRLVSKQELLDAVWPNVFVSDDSLVQCIRELREKLGDAEHRLIRTVPRRGYMLDAPLLPATLSAGDSSTDQPVASQLPPVTIRRRHVHQRLIPIGLGALACVALALGFLAIPSGIIGPNGRVTRSDSPQHRAVIKDCDVCPEMVALPAGSFPMGSPAEERGRALNEELPRPAAVAKPFAIGKYEVTVEQFAAFIADTETPVSDQCRLIDPAVQTPDALRKSQAARGEPFDLNSVNWGPREASFREQRGFAVTPSHPAGCISWIEAEAYVTWLSRRTGKPYRLPTDAEWEYAARAGTTTRFSFGDDDTELCAYARFADLNSPFIWRTSCRSDINAPGSIPVGMLKPNAWGLHDMHGNVWEWVEDCWRPNLSQGSAEGSAMERPTPCDISTVRGGSWASGPARVRSAMRQGLHVSSRDQNIGFRVALTLGE